MAEKSGRLVVRTRSRGSMWFALLIPPAVALAMMFDPEARAAAPVIAVAGSALFLVGLTIIAWLSGRRRLSEVRIEGERLLCRVSGIVGPGRAVTIPLAEITEWQEWHMPRAFDSAGLRLFWRGTWWILPLNGARFVDIETLNAIRFMTSRADG